MTDRRKRFTRLVLVISLLFVGSASAQQSILPDTASVPEIADPIYPGGDGSTICLDAAHNNLHTVHQGYVAFGKLLRKDGYQLKSNSETFEKTIPDHCKILVIANALNERNLGGNWNLPTPSAFTDKEIDNLVDWVSKGGSLFLIADHMPFPGAAETLVTSFGFTFINGFALKEEQTWPPSLFRKSEGTLHSTELTEGIDSVASFTGQAFQIPEEAQSIMTFNNQYYALMPDTAWRFKESTPSQMIEGWSQGAFMKFRKGRLVVFGEAAMFSARKLVQNDLKVGFNDRKSHQNVKLLLNIIHWLDGQTKQ
ncbi:MAG: DUF4350 domain-containing protein [Balneolaceae bacterium]|nr:DUF4350 domain-containing protein [Balneolaceae bacterium]